jgi:hypothetical protein
MVPVYLPDTGFDPEILQTLSKKRHFVSGKWFSWNGSLDVIMKYRN